MESSLCFSNEQYAFLASKLLTLSLDPCVKTIAISSHFRTLDEFFYKPQRIFLMVVL